MNNREIAREFDSIAETATPVRAESEISTAGYPSSAASGDIDAETSLNVSGYDLLGELGSGGMGRVFRGRDAHLGREVAVKVLLEKHAARPDLAKRFVREARIHSQLQHPGVAPIHELGESADGRPYFTMKVVKGQTLAELLKQRQNPADDRGRFIKVFENACQTLAFAHEHKVIHRDLKPGNVMVGKFGEVQVMDWGLAKVLTEKEDSNRTASVSERSELRDGACAVDETDLRTGAGVGTLPYMPPEQMLGELDLVDERSDVFGLGAILCEILTGFTPYLTLPREFTPQAIRDELEGSIACLDACGADAELIALAKRCLTADPIDRPRDAGVLASEVTAYLESVEARLQQAKLDRTAARVEAREQRRRRNLTVGLAVTVVAVLVLIGGSALWVQAKYAETEQNAESALAKAELPYQQFQRMPAADAQQATAATVVLKQAQSAVEEANSVLATGLSGEALHSRVSDRRTEIERELTQIQKEAKLFRDLDAARMARIIPPVAAQDHGNNSSTSLATGKVDYGTIVGRYRMALEDFGLPIVQDASRLAADIRRQRQAVREALIVGLDDWSVSASRLGDNAIPQWQFLSDVAQAVDDDDWRKKVRQWRREANEAQLVASADEAVQSRQSPVTIELLATALGGVGRPDESIKLLRRARTMYVNDFWIHHTLGMFLYEDDKSAEVLEEAIGCFMSSVILRPDSEIAYYHLGIMLSNKDDFAGAAAAYEAALQINPRLAEARNNFGDLLRKQNDLAGAAASYRAALEIKPHLPQALLNLGYVLMEQGDVEGAVEVSKRATIADPRNALAHYNLGTVLLERNDLDGAMAALSSALEIDARHFGARLNLGNVLKAQNDLDGAIKAYQAAIEIDPQSAMAYYNLGLALMLKNDVEAAIAAYKTALVIDPKLVVVHNDLGTALYRKKDADGALAAYQSALEIDPTHLPSLMNIGGVRMGENDVKGAITAFRAGLAIDPRSVDAHYNLGIALTAAGDLHSAVKAYQAAIKIEPRFAEAHTNLGNVLKDLQDVDGAIAAYRTALEIEPRLPAANYNLGIALGDKADFVLARDAFRRGLNQLPPNHPLRQRFSQEIQAMDQLISLEEELTDVLAGKPAPQNVDELLALGNLCIRLQRHADAVQFFAKAFAEWEMRMPRSEISDVHRYNAACCAALAGCGMATDGGALENAARAAMRNQAVAWLRANLETWTAKLEKGASDDCELVAQALRYCKADRDLAGIREAKHLQELPTEEQGACRQLWADVNALLTRAETSLEPLDAP